MPNLEGKIGIVTGATQGVGEAIAREAASCGAAGIALVGRNAEQADAVARTLGCEALFVPTELSDPDACRAVVPAAVERFGRVDFLVNAAGATDRGGILDQDLQTWDKLFAVNVRAPFILMQDAARVMVELAIRTASTSGSARAAPTSAAAPPCSLARRSAAAA